MAVGARLACEQVPGWLRRAGARCCVADGVRGQSEIPVSNRVPHASCCLSDGVRDQFEIIYAHSSRKFKQICI